MKYRGLFLSALFFSGGVQTAAVAEDKTAPAAKQICKGEVDTGSLVRKSKRCMTQAQWEQPGRRARDAAERLSSYNQQGLISGD